MVKGISVRFRNYDETIIIIKELSKNLKCVICKDISLNYNAKSSLAEHYRTYHKRKTVEFFLENIATKNPDELGDLLN